MVMRWVVVRMSVNELVYLRSSHLILVERALWWDVFKRELVDRAADATFSTVLSLRGQFQHLVKQGRLSPALPTNAGETLHATVARSSVRPPRPQYGPRSFEQQSSRNPGRLQKERLNYACSGASLAP